ncbi:MAG: hypothetical protein WCP45_12960 [Verrucomicrobiota bacterium]
MPSSPLPCCLASAPPHADLRRHLKGGFLTTLPVPLVLAVLLPAISLAESHSPAKPEAPAGGAAATPGTPAAGKTILFGGATLRLGMTKAEVMAQIERNPDAGWFVQELDSPPTGELYKMDKWGLSCKHAAAGTSGGGTVALSFENEKLAKIEEGK